MAQTLGLSIQLDKRLIERKLSSQSISDQAFEATLKQLWKNPAISLSGGESNLTAQKRVLSFLQDLEKLHQNEHIILAHTEIWFVSYSTILMIPSIITFGNNCLCRLLSK